MAREQGADVLYEQPMRIERKLQEFIEAVKSLEGLEKFNLQALNDQFSSGSAIVSFIEF